MRKIFISYSICDIAVAQSISNVTERHGYRSHADFASLAAGGDFAKQITSFIKKSDFVLFIVSESSLNSQWSRREIEYATQQGKTIIPILYKVSDDEVKSSWLYNFVQNTHWINWDNNGEGELILFLAKFQKLPINPDAQPNKRPTLAYRPYYAPNYVPNYAPKKSKKGCKIGCLCSILVLVIIAFIWVTFRVGSPNISAPDSDRDVCYAPNPSSSATAPICIDDTIMASDDKLSSDTVIIEEFHELEYAPLTDYEESDALNADENNGIVLGIILAITFLSIIGFVAYRVKHRKITVKLVADESCEVFADNQKIAELSANNVNFSRLKKGKHYLTFKPLDKAIKQKSISYSVNQSDDLISIALDKTKDDASKSRTIKCFIAGSTKLESERDALRAAIAQTHNHWTGKNVEILSYTYEDFERKVIEGGHQQLYDDFITNEATIAVFIISGEIGEFTITEFEKALNAYKSGRHPQILVFNNEHATYHEQAETLKKMVASEKQYWVDYDSLKTLKLQFMSTLNWLLIDSMYK